MLLNVDCGNDRLKLEIGLGIRLGFVSINELNEPLLLLIIVLFVDRLKIFDIDCERLFKLFNDDDDDDFDDKVIGNSVGIFESID